MHHFFNKNISACLKCLCACLYVCTIYVSGCIDDTKFCDQKPSNYRFQFLNNVEKADGWHQVHLCFSFVLLLFCVGFLIVIDKINMCFQNNFKVSSAVNVLPFVIRIGLEVILCNQNTHNVN
jgi:hypothetical protein